MGEDEPPRAERRAPRKPRWYQARTTMRALGVLALTALGAVVKQCADLRPVSQASFVAEVEHRQAADDSLRSESREFRRWAQDSILDVLIDLNALSCVSARRADPRLFEDLRRASRVHCEP